MPTEYVPAFGWMLPFVLLLLAMAVLPLATPHFWESNLRKLAVAALLALPVAALYLRHFPQALLHAASDYVSFIVLLGSLFVVSGGILVTGDIQARPAVNTAFLVIGALLASFIGTTGASMLLIRPLLATNRQRTRRAHTVVFFIFVVSNVGGCLTPLGDPPLFLGYLRGVPFAWTFRLFPHWLLALALLLVVYYLWDRSLHARETPRALSQDRTTVEPIRVRGAVNLGLLLFICGAVAVLRAPWRELVMIGLAAFSWAVTPGDVRKRNVFTFAPIAEVAALFLGIFVTMLPALDVLRASGASLGISSPNEFFWMTGLLSSFLDNAPTYVTFLTIAQSLGLPNEVVGVTHEVLAAISVGAVFMGANTYIGNGPNLMVRAIAESDGVPMPSFFGYMLYSLAVLIPCFVVTSIVFFR
jgi:Na+/H+ antiporter NhaD/arsenite permease-like protein